MLWQRAMGKESKNWVFRVILDFTVNSFRDVLRAVKTFALQNIADMI